MSSYNASHVYDNELPNNRAYCNTLCKESKSDLCRASMPVLHFRQYRTPHCWQVHQTLNILTTQSLLTDSLTSQHARLVYLWLPVAHLDDHLLAWLVTNDSCMQEAKSMPQTIATSLEDPHFHCHCPNSDAQHLHATQRVPGTAYIWMPHLC